MQIGEILTVPTETVEGYAVRIDDEVAIKKLMDFKERGFDSDKIFPLVPESKDAISKYVIIPPAAKPLIDKYLPGELTLILPKNPNFRNFYFDHYDSIGVRIPNHPLFVELLAENGPLLLTSANRRGGTPRSFTGHRPSTVISFIESIRKLFAKAI